MYANISFTYRDAKSSAHARRVAKITYDESRKLFKDGYH